MRIYLRILAVIMLAAAFFDGREIFIQASPLLRGWFVGLLLLDLFAVVGLWRRKTWGVNTFIFLDCLELVIYCVFAATFADSGIRLGVAIAAILGYLLVAYKDMSAGFKTGGRKPAAR